MVRLGPRCRVARWGPTGEPAAWVYNARRAASQSGVLHVIDSMAQMAPIRQEASVTAMLRAFVRVTRRSLATRRYPARCLPGRWATSFHLAGKFGLFGGRYRDCFGRDPASTSAVLGGRRHGTRPPP